MKRIIQSVMVCSLIFLVTSACSDDDTEMVLMGNVEGTLNYKGLTYVMVGGLLDDKAENVTSTRETYQVKISDQPIDTTLYNSLTIYSASYERLNLIFSLSARVNFGLLEEGAYLFHRVASTSDLPFTPFLWHARAAVGNGQGSISFHDFVDGEVIIDGDFPEYTLEFDLTDDTGDQLTGRVNGRFITTEDWK